MANKLTKRSFAFTPEDMTQIERVQKHVSDLNLGGRVSIAAAIRFAMRHAVETLRNAPELLPPEVIATWRDAPRNPGPAPIPYTHERTYAPLED